MKKHLKLLFVATIIIFMKGQGSSVKAQGIMGGHVTGNVQLDGQFSSRDSIIGATDVPEKMLSNVRADILYTNGNFSAGLRYEAYLNPMLGFDPSSKFKGQGIANYFVSYKTQNFTVTAGHFYEQFGNGMTLRAYEDRYLGIDNALRGVNVMYRPFRGITFKGVLGQQRYFWETRGLVRGVDGEVNLNDLITSWNESKTRLTLGGSFVSKYEDDETILSDMPGYKLQLPKNVGAASVRMGLAHGGFGLQAEYARKGQDPWLDNGYIYKPGEALWLSASYSQKGLSANIQAKRVDNMGFKSVRSVNERQMLYINYIPSITKLSRYKI